MFSVVKNKISRLPAWSPLAGLGVIGIVAVIFNDALGEDGIEMFVLLYSLLLIFIVLRWIFAQVRSVISLKREQAKMEMLHLKSQVNPHFFFNTLNNLYGLVDKNPKEAQQLILKLSDLMRYSIYEGQKEWVTLEEEIEYLKNYVEIQKDRYHKTVTIDFNISIDKPRYKIMPLMLILLVENAFKHGVEKLINDAFVEIDIVASEGRLEFNIRNNFDTDEENKLEAGIGLSNMKRRLEIGYKNNFDFSTAKENGIYQAQLSLSKL